MAPPAPSLFAFSLGPVQTRRETALIFMGLLDGEPLGPADSTDPVLALRDLAGRVPPGTPLTCAEDLEAAASAAGFRCAPFSEEALAVRALVALALVHGDLVPRAHEEVLVLMRAAARFWEAAPWQRLPDDAALQVRVAGPRPRSLECAVLGAAGEMYGAVLYPEAGSVRRVVRAQEEGRPEAVRRIDQVVVTLDDEPDFACEAVWAWCGLPRVPTTYAIRRGEPGPISAEEALLLAATLEALTGMSGIPGEVGTASAAVGGDAVTVSVQAWTRPSRRGRR